MAFNQQKPAEAAKKYIGDNIFSIIPVPDGAAAFYNYFEGNFKKYPKSRAEVKRVIGDGDLVVLHLNSRTDDRDRGKAIIDIFRLKKGKLLSTGT